MMRTRIYIGLAVVLTVAAVGVTSVTLFESGDSVAEQRADAVDGDFVAAEAPDEPNEAKRTDLHEAKQTAEVAEKVAEQDPQKRSGDDSATPTEVGQSNDRKTQEEWDTAVLQVVTNFEKADVTVNGLPYPEYTDEDEPEGMILPAGGPHLVRVTYEGNTKTYQVFLSEDETRILMVELSGMKGGGSATPAKARARPKKRKAQEKEEENDEKGRVTVYSKPNGKVMIDGSSTDEQTPGTVEVEPGRHTIQVQFEGGEESEKKIVRVRKGSRIKLFFRKRDND